MVMSGVVAGPKAEPREFELKLEFDPADLAAIEAHPLLAGIRFNRQALVSVYYDTESGALLNCGRTNRSSVTMSVR